MEQRKIIAKEVAQDIHAGMGDTALMDKYDLSAKQLEMVLRKMVEADLIDHMQLYERTTLSDTQITKAFTFIPRLRLRSWIRVRIQSERSWAGVTADASAGQFCRRLYAGLTH